MFHTIVTVLGQRNSHQLVQVQLATAEDRWGMSQRRVADIGTCAAAISKKSGPSLNAREMCSKAMASNPAR
jgi:hypothetical protein